MFAWTQCPPAHQQQEGPLLLLVGWGALGPGKHCAAHLQRRPWARAAAATAAARRWVVAAAGRAWVVPAHGPLPAVGVVLQVAGLSRQQPQQQQQQQQQQQAPLRHPPGASARASCCPPTQQQPWPRRPHVWRQQQPRRLQGARRAGSAWGVAPSPSQPVPTAALVAGGRRQQPPPGPPPAQRCHLQPSSSSSSSSSSRGRAAPLGVPVVQGPPPAAALQGRPLPAAAHLQQGAVAVAVEGRQHLHPGCLLSGLSWWGVHSCRRAGEGCGGVAHPQLPHLDLLDGLV